MRVRSFVIGTIAVIGLAIPATAQQLAATFPSMTELQTMDRTQLTKVLQSACQQVGAKSPTAKQICEVRGMKRPNTSADHAASWCLMNNNGC